ncbi:MAG: PqqD family protein [Trichodesmium sp. St16_bin4-tuft]|uniref:Coenzyme PQQ synthesis D n=1 Tax=Trichodesmium erythraeum (strain IMS101) TaxID=203124 RepID=Q10VP6_TRIEI|nr:PqqD family protein [Trichodesmium erythraeum GBRTRLIN201]MCL2929249.1 PqqD family protein [Trichodesmium sp. MAG_R01]MDE5101013.1 PqqD family protein [Trichodesmium sp. St16_bin4-tuft]MDE5103258.1 PqqD family protein [Trichodesmium sp. St19_bin2]MDT9339435.1 PqqD family protein [Trichodesmium erythraeum 21-75]
MNISFTQKVVLTDNFFLAEDEGGIFIVNAQQEGQDFLLDDVAAQMLFALVGSDSIQEAYEDILELEEVDPEVFKNDLLEYIEDLKNDGIIKIIHQKDKLYQEDMVS